VCSEKEENVIQRKNLRNTVPILCAVKKWLWNAGRWARRWTVKLVRDSGGVLNGAPQFAGRPEGEVSGTQTSTGCGRAERRTFSLPGFVADRGEICFSQGSLPRFFLHVRDPFVMPH
jgi:hypothetical protein